jgi:large subunit ribosomal protein L3
MSLGLLGKKIGMTRIFNEDGSSTPVTVIDVAGNQFLQVKTLEKDGYSAVQVGYGEQKEHRLNKPDAGQFKKYGSSPKREVVEFRVDSDADLPNTEGGHPGATLFQAEQWIDVIGTTKGKGFAGVMKRYNFGGLKQTHGSMMHRRTGAVGAGSTPGRVWKNQKMPGRHGSYRRTIQNLKVVQVREDDGVILVSGAIPGSKGSLVIIRPAKKRAAPAAAAAE